MAVGRHDHGPADGFQHAGEVQFSVSPRNAAGKIIHQLVVRAKQPVQHLHGAMLYTGNIDAAHWPAGFGILGPYARSKGWAPGAITDWQTGASGWILWVSLAIMVGDSVTSLGLLSA